MRTAWAPYRELAWAGLRSRAAYRLALVAGMTTNSVFGLLRASLLLYAVGAAGGTVAGYGRDDMAAYVWLGQALLAVIALQRKALRQASRETTQGWREAVTSASHAAAFAEPSRSANSFAICFRIACNAVCGTSPRKFRPFPSDVKPIAPPPSVSDNWHVLPLAPTTK